jgi:hypothetical protein
MSAYYYLKKGEVIKEGDEVKRVDVRHWETALGLIGGRTDILWIARRKIKQEKEPDKTSQNDIVYKYIKTHKRITINDALRFKPKVTRLAARIADLKSEGHDIRSVWIDSKEKKHVCKAYFLGSVK